MDSGSDFFSKDQHGTRQKSPLWPPFPPSLRGEETLKPPAKRTETQSIAETEWGEERVGPRGFTKGNELVTQRRGDATTRRRNEEWI